MTAEVRSALEGAGRRSRARLRPARDGRRRRAGARRSERRPRPRDGASSASSTTAGRTSTSRTARSNPWSHVRASLSATSVVIPLDGRQASRSAPGRASSSASSTAPARGGSSSRPCTDKQMMAAPVVKGEELVLAIDSLAFGGNGVARLNGFVVFVRRGLPGDTVRARVTKVKGNHAEADAVELLEPGAARVEAPCDHFGACGGCRLQDLALRGAAGGEGDAGPGCAPAARRPAGCSARAHRPRRRAVRLPQQARVVVHADARGACARLPSRRSLGRGARDRALPHRDAGRQRHPRRGPRVGPARGPSRLLPGERRGLPASSRRARGAEHRPGARRPRDRPGGAARSRGGSSTPCDAFPRCGASSMPSTTVRPK